MGLQILVADHSESISKAIELSLVDFTPKMKSFVPSSVKDTSNSSFETEFLKIASTFQPNIIFLDTLLSQINGYEIAKKLKSHQQFKSVPVVLMYSSVVGIDSAKLKTSGADASLEKPFTKKQLHAVVTKVIKLDSSSSATLEENVEDPFIESLKNIELTTSNQTSPQKPTQPTGLISSASELEELQKSLSEADGEEDFQQVSLEQVSSQNDMKTSTENHPLKKSDSPPKKDQPSLDSLLDFSDMDLTNQLTQDSTHNTDKQSNTSPLSERSPINNGNTSQELPLDLQEDIEIELESDTTEDANIGTEGLQAQLLDLQEDQEDIEIELESDTPEIVKSNTTKEARVKTPEVEKPKTSFQLDIPEEDIDGDDQINLVEPEEEITHIHFLTSPEAGSSHEDKTNQASQTFKKRDLEEVQARLKQNEALESRASSTPHKSLTKKTTLNLESQVKEALASQKDLQEAVQKEIKKAVQDHIQRFLRDELPAMAQKLIKEEVDRLLSEQSSQ